MDYKEYLNIIEQASILDQNGKYAESDKLIKTANLKVSQNFGDLLGGLASGAAGSALGGGGRINAPGAIAGGIAQQAFGGNPLIGAGVGYLASKLFPRKKRKQEQDAEKPSTLANPSATTEPVTQSYNSEAEPATQPNPPIASTAPATNLNAPVRSPNPAANASDLPPNVINKLMTFATDPNFRVDRLWQKINYDNSILPKDKRKAYDEFFKIKQQYQTLTSNMAVQNASEPSTTNQTQVASPSTTTVNPVSSNSATPTQPASTGSTVKPTIREDLVQQALIEMYRAPDGVKITALNNFANNKKLSYDEKKKAYDIFMKNFKK